MGLNWSGKPITLCVMNVKAIVVDAVVTTLLLVDSPALVIHNLKVPDDLYLSLANCSDSLTVPILQSMASNLLTDRSLLAEALMGGFNVNYSLPNDGE
ncbi:hypothetical protein FNV43_RR13973 [Rhamnella rubrinervis]|uniref:Uncharacterized protein n=1 Tax=Rhamnella rubrinervis TaxID=2594499 RepID=A0A8K0H2E4_9ROSA|nr:hypothetical protein FNV43_RR13973 [Rhamnella rubrinervis]